MATPVVPPIAMPSVSLRMISNLSVRSSVTRYSVPPSAFVMFFAATRIVSSSRSDVGFPGERDADVVELLQAQEQIGGVFAALCRLHGRDGST